jgi:hypothetical protein
MRRVALTLMLSWMLVGVALAGPMERAPVPPPEGPLTHPVEVADALFLQWSASVGPDEARRRLLRLEGTTGALLVEHVEGPLPKPAPEPVGEAALEEAHP